MKKIVIVVLLVQYRTKIRGHSSGLPNSNLDPRPSNMLGVNIELLAESPGTIDKTQTWKNLSIIMFRKWFSNQRIFSSVDANSQTQIFDLARNQYTYNNPLVFGCLQVSEMQWLKG